MSRKGHPIGGRKVRKTNGRKVFAGKLLCKKTNRSNPGIELVAFGKYLIACFLFFDITNDGRNKEVSLTR